MCTSDASITVTVKLKATLGQYRPAGVEINTAFPVELPVGATVGELADRLGIPRRMVKLVFIDHKQRANDAPLADGEHLEVFPPIAGG